MAPKDISSYICMHAHVSVSRRKGRCIFSTTLEERPRIATSMPQRRGAIVDADVRPLTTVSTSLSKASQHESDPSTSDLRLNLVNLLADNFRDRSVAVHYYLVTLRQDLGCLLLVATTPVHHSVQENPTKESDYTTYREMPAIPLATFRVGTMTLVGGTIGTAEPTTLPPIHTAGHLKHRWGCLHCLLPLTTITSP